MFANLKKCLTSLLVGLSVFLISLLVFFCYFKQQDVKTKNYNSKTKATLTFEDYKRKVTLSDGSLNFDKFNTVDLSEYDIDDFAEFVAKYMEWRTSINLYSISGLDGLKAFSDAVENGTIFPDATVYLDKDVDCTVELPTWAGGGTGKQIFSIGDKDNYFKGTFDGRGHKIFNFSINWWESAGAASGSTGSKARAYGLFSKTSGTIKNLKIENISWSHSVDDSTQVGGLIGYSEGANINNCFVSNLSISKSEGKGRLYAGAIFCVGSATVTDCYVENFTTSSCTETASVGPACDATYIMSSGGYSSSWYHYTYTSRASTIGQCVINNSSSNQIATDSNYVAYGSSGGKNTPEHSVTNCHTEANTTTGLTHSCDGGPSETTWYYHEDYKDGYPQLRQFIVWRTVPIVAGAGASVDKDQIKLPNDATKIYASDKDTIKIYGQEVTASKKPGLCDHSKVKWAYVNATDSYTVTYPRHIREVAIYKNSVSSDNLIKKSDTTQIIYCCSPITITYDGYSQSGMASSIKISCGDFTHVYTPSNTYTISNAQDIKDTYTQVDESNNIIIKVELKQYGIVVS